MRGMGSGIAALGASVILAGCGDPSIGPGWQYIGRAGGMKADVWIQEAGYDRVGDYLKVRERAQFDASGTGDPSVRAIETVALYDCGQRRFALKSMRYFSDRNWATTPAITEVEDGAENWSTAGGSTTIAGKKMAFVCDQTAP